MQSYKYALCFYRSHITEDGMETEFDTYFPRVDMTGAYKGEGRIDGLSFNSKGNFNFTFSKWQN